MICHHCNTENEADHDFCVTCGQPINATVQRPSPFHQPTPPGGATTPGRSVLPWVVGAGGFVIVLLIVGGIFAAYQLAPREALPTHLGMFVQSEAKDRVDEIRRQDSANAIDAKTSILKDESLPALPALPNLILNADSRDINVNDMRLVQLDTIKDDGSMKTLDIQVMPVEGKPEMKRIRVPDGLANGKYAFAVFDSYINEGKQRLWPFQVRDATKSDNGSSLKAATVPIKPKETAAATPAPVSPQPSNRPAVPPPMPAGPPPTGMRTVTGNGVRARIGPGTSYGFHPTFRFKRGMSVNVIGYSGYECPKTGKGCGPWAEIAGGYFVHSSLLR